jgi:hypothetical protein
MAPPPFLPEHAPPPAPPEAPKKNAWKTLLLWVVLIVLFLTIWQFLSPSPSNGPPAPKLPPCETPFPWTSIVAPLVVCTVCLLIFARVMRQLRGSTTFNASQEPGAIALAERRFGDALAVFRRLRDEHAKKPLYRAVALVNIAEAELWAGRLDEAIAAYVDIERTTGVLFSAGIRVIAASELTLLYALKGDLEASTRWSAETMTRLGKTHDERLVHGVRVCLAEAIVLCRRGAAAEAVGVLDARWTTMRHAFTANWMRVVEIVRAFAEAQGPQREQNVVAERLVRVEPVVGDELAFLGAGWPEMRAFLVAHGIVKGS